MKILVKMAERLLTTSYRYEVFNPNTKMMQKALVNQNTRIQVDELMASRLKEEALHAKEFERSIWLSNLDEKSEERRQKIESKSMKDELKCVNKEIVLVRRAKLKKLFEQEGKQYEKELHQKGKAFYLKRV